MPFKLKYKKTFYIFYIKLLKLFIQYCRIFHLKTFFYEKITVLQLLNVLLYSILFTFYFLILNVNHYEYIYIVINIISMFIIYYKCCTKCVVHLVKSSNFKIKIYYISLSFMTAAYGLKKVSFSSVILIKNGRLRVGAEMKSITLNLNITIVMNSYKYNLTAH